VNWLATGQFVNILALLQGKHSLLPTLPRDRRTARRRYKNEPERSAMDNEKTKRGYLAAYVTKST